MPVNTTMPDKKKTPPKVTVAMTQDMIDALEVERKIRKIATVPEVVRIIVSDYFKTKSQS